MNAADDDFGPLDYPELTAYDDTDEPSRILSVLPARSTESPIVSAARTWFGRGFVPMSARKKKPNGLGWQVLDPAEHLERVVTEPPEQIGLRMGKQRDGQRWLIAIDVDGEVGQQSLATLEAELGALPSTLRQRTGGGGEHLIVEWPAELADSCPTTSASKLAPKIDIRGERGHIVAAPSIHDSGRHYEVINDADPAPLPELWVRRILEAHRAPVAAHAPDAGARASANPGASDATERCRRYIERMDPAISGSGGHGATWRAAQVAVRGFDLGLSGAMTVLREYNSRCQPPWSEKELAHKLDSAERGSKMPRGYLLQGRRDEWRTETWQDSWRPEWNEQPGERDAEGAADGANSKAPTQSKRRWEMLGAADLAQLSKEFLDRLQDGREAPIPTGHTQLDEQLDGGFWPGLHVFCGPTGSLKTQMALTSAINAARAGTPVVVIALEQRRGAWATRVQAELSGTSWSRAIRNQMSPEDKSRCLTAEWPASLYLVPGEPYAFPIDCVVEIAAEMRKRHPTGQALIVVDYCQLQGDINLSDETRQRVMRAALAAQRAAHKYDLAVLLLSSVAREHYAKLADLPCKPSMLGTRDTDRGPVRELKSAHALIGLGKEAGELEFSAESVTIIAKGQHADIPGAHVVVAATAKRRCGNPSWCAFRTEHGRLYAATDYRLRADADGVDAAEAGVNHDALIAKCDKAILDALAEHPGGLSKNGVREAARGHRKEAVDGRLAYLEEIAGAVHASPRPGRGGGSVYKLVDPEYRKRHEQAKALAARAEPAPELKQTDLALLDDGEGSLRQPREGRS